jgi:hypothetical protein
VAHDRACGSARPGPRDRFMAERPGPRLMTEDLCSIHTRASP